MQAGKSKRFDLYSKNYENLCENCAMCYVTYSGLHLNFHLGCIKQNGFEEAKIIC